MFAPKFFNKLFDQWLLPIFIVSALALGYGVYAAFFNSPLDYQQKETVRIMYVHVPAAWLAVGIYAVMGMLSAVGLVRNLPFCFLISRAVAPIGLCFTLICIANGHDLG